LQILGAWRLRGRALLQSEFPQCRTALIYSKVRQQLRRHNYPLLNSICAAVARFQ
jgi:hypothetical protein